MGLDVSLTHSPLDEGSLDEGSLDEGLLDEFAPDEGVVRLDMEVEEPWAPESEEEGRFWVRVTLDGAPFEGALITQGGSARRWYTSAEGLAWVSLDLNALDSLTLFASHAEARTKSARVEPTRRAPLSLDLVSAERPDEPSYPFSDPGEPSRRASTAQCGHCHLNNNDDWFASPHSRSAQNPIVYDLYTGRASGWRDEERCVAAGGRWALGQVEGQDERAWQCYQPLSLLGSLYEACAQPPCDTTTLSDVTQGWGGCADCHAPAVEGVARGGHDLLSARGHTFEYGVSCDLCHHVEDLSWGEPAGVGGRLALWRPSESASVTLGGGGRLPLSFGPSPDVSNPRMGISPREHFRSGALCGGCHQHDHSDAHSLTPVERARWPEGVLPNQSTYAEWLTSPVAEVAACNACHMPPLAGVMNGGNLERFESADVGVQGGWPRPLGEARAHSWWGPRQPEGGVLRLSASLSLELTALDRATLNTDPLLGASQTRLDALEARGQTWWRARLRVSNVGAGHGLPTGEPMRHLISLVELTCSAQGEGEVSRAEPIGGDVVHELGGALKRLSWRPLAELRLPEARVGDHLSVSRPLNEPLAYEGYGAFGSREREESQGLPEGVAWVGRLLAPEERGLWREVAVGEAVVSAVSEGGALTLNDLLGAPLPSLMGQAGDVISLKRSHQRSGEQTGEALIGEGYAGASGFSFARVTRDASARPLSPHFVASDISRDNRLAPDQSWESEHLLSAPCEAPLASGALLYRPYPLWLVRERGWALHDEVIASVVTRPAQPHHLTLAPQGPAPVLSEVSEAYTLDLEPSEALSEAIEELTQRAEENGEQLDEEREGEALALASAPTLWATLGESVSLTLTRSAQSGGTLSLTQGAWRQSAPSQPLEAGGALSYALRPERWGAESYEVSPQNTEGGEVTWRGALIALPHALRERSAPALLSLGRAEARAATRQARPWPWRLERGALSERLLSPLNNLENDLESAAERPLQELNLSTPQPLINMSTLPLALEVPEGVSVWGGEVLSAALNTPTPRSPQRPVTRHLALLAPGQGTLLWAQEGLSAPVTLYAVGYSAHGGRSWLPPTPLATLTSTPLTSPTLTLSDAEREALNELSSSLGEPLDLNLNTPTLPWTSLPPLTWAEGRSARVEAQHALSLPQPQQTWVYQGDRRAGAWRVGGARSEGNAQRPLTRGALLEVRNLSAQAHPFGVEGHLHQLINEQTGALSAPRARSWVPIRGRLLVIWPTEVEGWRAGALQTPERAEGLEVSPTVVGRD